MVTVSRRPWLFRVPHGFIKTVARCVRCFQRCFMRYFVTVQNAQASFSTSPAGAGWIHVLNILFAYLGAPADTRSKFGQAQLVAICSNLPTDWERQDIEMLLLHGLTFYSPEEETWTAIRDEWWGRMWLARAPEWVLGSPARKTERWRTGVTGGLIDFLDLRWKVLDKHRGGLYLWGWCDLHPPPAVHEVHWLMLANAG